MSDGNVWRLEHVECVWAREITNLPSPKKLTIGFTKGTLVIFTLGIYICELHATQKKFTLLSLSLYLSRVPCLSCPNSPFHPSPSSQAFDHHPLAWVRLSGNQTSPEKCRSWGKLFFLSFSANFRILENFGLKWVKWEVLSLNLVLSTFLHEHWLFLNKKFGKITKEW